MFSSRRK